MTDCNQGRNCPANKGTGDCRCTQDSKRFEFTSFELLLVLILAVLILYFAMSVAIHWGLK